MGSVTDAVGLVLLSKCSLSTGMLVGHDADVYRPSAVLISRQWQQENYVADLYGPCGVLITFLCVNRKIGWWCCWCVKA